MQKEERVKESKNESIDSQQNFTFLLEEYKMLRAEIESYSQQKRNLEIIVITALLGIYSWVGAANLQGNIEKIILGMPIVIVLIAVYRFFFYNKVIQHEIYYVRNNIEKKIVGEKSGWEAYWANTKAIRYLWGSEWVLWSIIFLITIAMFFFFHL
jgi:hypothetical protein